jgi:hypothetical protein
MIASAWGQQLTAVAPAATASLALWQIIALVVAAVACIVGAWWLYMRRRGKGDEAKKIVGGVVHGIEDKAAAIDWGKHLKDALDLVHRQAETMAHVVEALHAKSKTEPPVLVEPAPLVETKSAKADEITAAVFAATGRYNAARSIVSLLQGGSSVDAVAGFISGQKEFAGYTAEDVAAIRDAMQRAGIV